MGVDSIVRGVRVVADIELGESEFMYELRMSIRIHMNTIHRVMGMSHFIWV